MLISKINGFKLCREGEEFYVKMPDNTTMVNLCGSKKEVIDELKRWKKEIDSNNPFMLEIENIFIETLAAI